MMRSWVFALAALIALPTNAADMPQTITKPADLRGRINGLIKLPAEGVVAADVQGIGLVFITTDNRYVVIGQVYDMWQGKPLATLDDIREAGERVTLGRLGLKVEDLAPISYGSGKERVMIFVDPMCDACHRLLSELEPLKNQYTFDILIIPLLGKASGTPTRNLSCATDQAAAFAALAAGRRTQLAQQPNCSLLPIQKRFITARMIGVKGVPFVVAPDGRVYRGRPDDLAAFLEGRT